MNKKLSFYVLIGIVIVFAVLAYQLMASFFAPLFLSVLLVLVFHPLHLRLVKFCKGRQRIAAALTTTIVLLIVLVPMIGIMTMAAAEGINVVSRFDKDAAKRQVNRLRYKLGADIPYINDLRRIEANFKSLQEQVGSALEIREPATVSLISRIKRLETDLRQPEWNAPAASTEVLNSKLATLESAAKGVEEQADYESALQDALQEFHDYRVTLLGGQYQAWLKELANPTDEQLAKLVGQTTSTISDSLLSFTGKTGAVLGSMVLGLMIMVMAMFFFFADGPAINRGVMRVVPLDDGYKAELVAEFDRTSRAVVVATLLSAVVQGLLAGIGFYFAGLSSVFLLTLLSMVFALVPFVGAAAVWLPACLYLYFVGDSPTAAILLFLYCAAVVSTADNVVKPWVLHGQSNLHPLLALLSVLGGVQALGPIGILVGPMVVVFLQTLLKILQRELKTIERTAATESG